MAAVDRSASDFGARMKRARETHGVSLREIADVTKISVAALEALERNDISRLPGGIFSRSFVRAYALAINVDPEQTVREFLAQFPHESITAGSPHYRANDDPLADRGRQRARAFVIAMVILLPLAAVAAYFVYGRPYLRARSSFAEREAGIENGRAVSSSLAEPLTFEVVTKAPLRLQVTLDGLQRESRAVKAGERLLFQAQREMTLITSDGGAIQLSINNQPTVSLGKSGEPRTVSIDRANFESFLASQ